MGHAFACVARGAAGWRGWRWCWDPTRLHLATASFEHPGQGETRGRSGWVAQGWATARPAGLAGEFASCSKARTDACATEVFEKTLFIPSPAQSHAAGDGWNAQLGFGSSCPWWAGAGGEHRVWNRSLGLGRR